MPSVVRLPITSVCFFIAFATAASAQFGVFHPIDEPVPIAVGRVVGVGDFDNDGDVDLATTVSCAALNDGSGTFTKGPSAANLSSGLYGNGAVGTLTLVTDLTGDGLPDILGSGGSTTFGLARSAGGANFTTAFASTPAITATGGLSALVGALAAADIDGDGDRDLFVSVFTLNGSNVVGGFQPRLFLNSGTGTFTDGTNRLPAVTLAGSQAYFVDYDGDLDQDILVISNPTGPAASPGGQTRLLLTNTGGFFAVSPINFGTAPTDTFCIGDMNGDNLKDIVFCGVVSAANPTPVDELWLATGTGSFTLAQSATRSERAFHAAVLPGTPNAPARLLRVATSGAATHTAANFNAAMQTIPNPSLGGSLQDLEADVDNDGDQDMFLFGAAGIRMFMDTGTGLLSERRRELPLEALGNAPTAGDVNHDGRTDLAVLVEIPTPTVRFATNDGFGRFTWTSLVCTNPCPSLANRIPHLVDVDGDGFDDLYLAMSQDVVTVAAPYDDYVLRNNHNGTFTLIQTFSQGGNAWVLKDADLDGDGDRDLVIGRRNTLGANGPDAQSVIMRNNGAGFDPPIPLGIARNTVDISIFDADGDLDLDILQTNGQTLLQPAQPAILHLNNGSGVFTPGAFSAVGTDTGEAADLDGDGDMDIVIDLNLYQNNGSGTFALVGALPSTAVTPFQTSAHARGLVDIDGDGDVDCVDATHIWRNAGGGFFPSYEPLVLNTGQFSLGAALGSNGIILRDFDRDGDPDLIGVGPRLDKNLTRQLANLVEPRPGRNTSLEFFGPASDTFALFLAGATNDFAVPPYGTVFLDFVTLSGPINLPLNGQGRGSLPFAVPPGPGLVGLSAHWQALVLSQVRLTNLTTTTVIAY